MQDDAVLWLALQHSGIRTFILTCFECEVYLLGDKTGGKDKLCRARDATLQL